MLAPFVSGPFINVGKPPALPGRKSEFDNSGSLVPCQRASSVRAPTIWWRGPRCLCLSGRNSKVRRIGTGPGSTSIDRGQAPLRGQRSESPRFCQGTVTCDRATGYRVRRM
jgi:hypothetical protein